MHVLLLLAGQSTRFWPLREKALFPIAGKTILEHQVERLAAAGLRDITFVGNAQNLAEVRRLFPKAKAVEQADTAMGMQGALLAALPTCAQGPVLVVSSNDVVEASAYKAVVAAAKKKGVDGAILAKRMTSYFHGGYLTVRGARVCGIVEKPGAGNEPSDLVNLVVHAFNDPASFLRKLSEQTNTRDDGYERALDALLPSHTVVAVPYEGVWLPVKYPWNILPLTAYLLDGITKQKIHKTARVHKTAVLEGPVVLDEGAQVFAHACIRGPAYIGKRAIVANNALVRSSSVGDDCIVGFSTEVKGSALAAHVWTHMAYVGDSVVGTNVSFGAGAVTGNLRLDEAEIHSQHGGLRVPTGLTKFGAVVGDDCRIGIHTGINPGCKIGSGSFLASGVLVTTDIPTQSFVTMKGGEISVRRNTSAAPQPEGRTRYRNSVSRAMKGKRRR